MNWSSFCLSIFKTIKSVFTYGCGLIKLHRIAWLILNTYHSGTCVNNNRTEPDLLDIIQLSSNPVLNVAPTIQLLSSPQVYFSPNYVCLPFLIVFNFICLLFLVLTKVIYTKYSKHWPYTVAHTIDCVCIKC